MSSKKPTTIKELIQYGHAFPALLPLKNNYLLSDEGIRFRESGKSLPADLETRLRLVDFAKLDRLDAYTVPFIAHDYSAKTPLMWNTLYEQLRLNIRNIMLVADPSGLEAIREVLKKDPKYLGGGFGVGFKEKGLSCVDKVVPADLAAVNIVVKDEKTGELVGYNTDASGFVESLREKMQEAEKKIDGGTFIVLGAGGVAKEVVRLLARKGAKRIRILNRTEAKAAQLAYEINREYAGVSAIGAGEDIIRGYLLNSFNPPDAVINLTDKGADGQLENFAAFADTTDQGYNATVSRTIARELSKLNPKIVVADIVLPKSGKSTTLRIAGNEGLQYLLDGKPMVIYQAAPAYFLVQEANPRRHSKIVSEEEALDVFTKTVLGQV